MTRGIFGAAEHAVRRIANLSAIAAIAVALCAPATAADRAAASPPPIRIPPAQVPVPRPISPSATTATIQPVPRALLPTDIEVLRDAQAAGLVMRGALVGNAESAVGVVLAIF